MAKGIEDALEITTTCDKCGSAVIVRVVLAAAHTHTDYAPANGTKAVQTEDLLRELKGSAERSPSGGPAEKRRRR